MNIWYIEKNNENRKKEILKDILLASLLPISISILTKLAVYYHNGKYKLLIIILLIIVILTESVFLTNKLFNKNKPTHVFIKDKNKKIIYFYLYSRAFNKYTIKKFYEESINMEKNIKEKINLPSIFYDIAITKENYDDYGMLIDKVYDIVEFKDYYEIYLSTPQNKIFKDELLVIPKNIKNIKNLLKELEKLKSTND